ncbi:hypothetical protein OG245_30700 [Streptomyces sp. NBC_01116]|uniref:hypothetical protein n=1 Tax=Streptomyces sp. NBC_01116 TaxID=2903752 RepID=UPI00324321D8
MGKTSKAARELYDALRALEGRAKTAYDAQGGQKYSRRIAAKAAEGHGSSLDRRLRDWLHDDFSKAKVPYEGSDERLIAVVQVWSGWAREPCDERWWRTKLEQAQPARPRRQTATVLEPVKASGYGAWIEQRILPARLLDRDSELRELAAFCGGEDLPGATGYMWWQAGPWAGKSALLSEFVLRHRPDDVDLVAYFIADYLGRNDQKGFLESVMRQLASLGEQDPSAAGARPEDFPSLCQAAAQACRDRGRRLVLVVDGLDEDAAGAGQPSIAALLPRNPPAGMRVVVTGRPCPLIPDDVPGDHPLRLRHIVRSLAPSPHAADISRMAGREVDQLLQNEQVGVPLLGLLVAARGSLTAADLTQLVGVRPFNVERQLRGVTGRSLVPGAHGEMRLPDTPVGVHPLALGHTELRNRALNRLGDVSEFEDRLYAWADEYQARGWPADTPTYLLYDYPHMLAGNKNGERLTAIALDPQRQQALLGRASPDVALSDIELSAHMIRQRRPVDVVALAGLAASRTLLTEQARSLPASFAVAFAWLGHSQRARQFALLAPHAAEKAVRLASVARALAGAGDQYASQAADVAKNAVWWADRARAESSPPSGDEYEAEAAVAEAAVALFTIGQCGQGRALLESLRSVSSYDDVALLAETTARAAAAARPHSAMLAEELLAEAEQHAHDVASRDPADPGAPVRAWAFVASVADPPRATRLYERITDYARSFPPGLTTCVVDAAAASALFTQWPEQAHALAQQAAQHLKAALTHPEALPERDAGDLTMLLGPMLTQVTRALVDVGCADEARDLETSVPEDRHTAFGWDVRAEARAVLTHAHEPAKEEQSAEVLARQACHLAEQNHPDEAHRRLHQALQAVGSSQGAAALREGWLITLCTALAVMGRHPDGALLARSLRDPADRIQALAATAVEAAAAGHLPDARRLAHEAADATSSFEGALDFSLFAGAPGIIVSNAKGAAAQALAFAGERERAVMLAKETDDENSDRRRRALVAVAAGLRAHDPAEAASIIDRQLEHLRTADTSPLQLREHIADLAELLAAIGDADQQCAERVREAVEQAWKTLKASERQWRVEDLLVLLLLRAPGRQADAERVLLARESSWQGIPPWELPTAAIAIAHAAFGALAAARASADGFSAPYDRAEAFAAVAGYLTGTPPSLRMVNESASTAFIQTFHTLALAQLPPDAAQTTEAAMRLSTDVLAGDGWHYALPVLSLIAPTAVLRVRDIVFAHRQLKAG